MSGPARHPGEAPNARVEPRARLGRARGWGALGAALGLAALALGGPRLFAQERPRAGTTAARPAGPGTGLAFAGQGTCVSCHATEETGPGFESAYAVWAADQRPGSHSQGSAPLFTERSNHMVRLLYGAKADPKRDPYPAANRRECLVCHGLAADGVQRGPGAIGDEGVSCEACHGPASRVGGAAGWLDRHYLPDWKERSKGYPSAALVAERARGGFWDQRSLVKRAETCLACHTTGGARGLDHAMLAAGHPDVSLELSRDLPAAPVHWRVERSSLPSEDAAAHRARLWAVGQAMAFREAMAGLGRFAATARRGRVDFAAFRCDACHHRLAPTDEAEVRLGERAGAPAPADEALALARQRDKAARHEGWAEAARQRGLGEPPEDVRAHGNALALAAELWGAGSPRTKAMADSLAILDAALALHDSQLDKVQVEAKKLELLAEQLAGEAERRAFREPVRRALLARLAEPAYATPRLLGFRAVELRASGIEALSGGKGADAQRALRKHLYDGADDLAKAPRCEQARPERFDPEQASKLLAEAFKAALGK